MLDVSLQERTAPGPRKGPPITGRHRTITRHGIDDPRLWRGGVVSLVLLASCVPSPAPADPDPSTDTSGGPTLGSSSSETTTGADETGTASCDDPEAAVAEIFAGTCADAGCHDPEAAAGLDLVSEGWAERLIGQPSSLCDDWVRVVPGEPAASLLVDKLGAPASCGEPMPLDGSLSPSQLDCIARWVSELPPVECPTCGRDSCIDTDSDPAHCGGCDAPCPAGIACDGGQCACPPGTTVCADACVDTMANGEHCGGCERPCPGAEVCLAGVCSAGCGTLTECDGGCVDTDTDPLHCGGCDSPCEAGGACSAGTCDCPGGPLTYTNDIEPMMVAGCTSMGCHGFPMPQEGLDLRAGAGYAGLVGMPSTQCPARPLVAPGQPSNSYLVDKLDGTDLCMGTRMPKGAASWSADQIAMVSAWICQGAPE